MTILGKIAVVEAIGSVVLMGVYTGMDKIVKTPIDKKSIQNNQCILADCSVAAGVVVAGYTFLKTKGM